jgi:hypothetical protein
MLPRLPARGCVASSTLRRSAPPSEQVQSALDMGESRSTRVGCSCARAIAAWAAVTVALPLGCGSGPGAVKQPILDRCETAALRNCETIADGLVLYLEGDEAAGWRKAGKALQANDPAAARDFLTSLLGLESRASAQPFMKTLRELSRQLDPTAADFEQLLAHGGKLPRRPATASAEHTGKSEKSSAREPPGSGAGANRPGGTPGGRGEAGEGTGSAAEAPDALAGRGTRSRPLVVTTPDSDASRIVTQTVSPSNHPDVKPCGTLSPTGGQCLLVAQGPMVLTDLTAPGTCPVFIAIGETVGDPGAPRWLLRAPLDLHGARLAVPMGFGVYVGITKADPTCSVTWSAIKSGSTKRDSDAP